MTKNAKVGLAVILVTLVMLFAAPGQHRRAPILGSELRLLFTQVNGLRVGDQVKVAGVPSGVITDIDFASDELSKQFSPVTGGLPLVEVTVSLDSFVKIPANSSYAPYTNLRNQRWLDIIPSGGDTYLSAEDDFFGQTATVQDDQMTKTLKAFRVLSDQTKSVRDMIADPNFSRQVKDTASNFRFYSRELAGASRTAPERLKALEEEMDRQELRLLNQIARMDEQVTAVRERMLTMVPQLNERLASWQGRLDRQKGDLQTLLVQGVRLTEQYEDTLQAYTTRFADREAAQRLVVRARKAARQLDEVRKVAQDLHALSSDPQVQADLRALIKKGKDRSQKLKDRIDEMQQKLDQLPIHPVR